MTNGLFINHAVSQVHSIRELLYSTDQIRSHNAYKRSVLIASMMVRVLKQSAYVWRWGIRLTILGRESRVEI